MERYPLDQNFSIKVSDFVFLPSMELQEKIDHYWNEQCKKKPLFNGTIFAVEKETSKYIEGFFTEYKYYIATQSEELRPHIPFRFLGLSCLVVCGDQVLAGRRSEQVASYCGYMEAVPQGVFEEGLNFWRQGEKELFEESGIDPSRIREKRLLGLFRDAQSPFDDLGLCFSLKEGGYTPTSSSEHDSLQFMPYKEFLELDKLISTSRELVLTWLCSEQRQV